jgi:hypothetical protein
VFKGYTSQHHRRRPRDWLSPGHDRSGRPPGTPPARRGCRG